MLKSMTPKHKSPKSTSCSSLSWLSVAEALNLRKKPSPFRSRNKVNSGDSMGNLCYLPPGSSNIQQPSVSLTDCSGNPPIAFCQGFVKPRTLRSPKLCKKDIPKNTPIVPVCTCNSTKYALSSATSETQLKDDLLQTVVDLRSQLEILREALEEQEKVSIAKDRLIERLTTTLQQGLNFQVSGNKRLPGMYGRSTSTGNISTEIGNFSQWQMSPTKGTFVDGVKYEFDDLV